MNAIIVADSAANLTGDQTPGFVSVPLTIITSEKEYIDDARLDIHAFIREMAAYKGKSGTACPSIGAWVTAFGDAEYAFGVTITSGLSGSYNAARIAANMYMDKHPGRKAFIVDSLSTGPEMALIVEKLRSYISRDYDFDTIVEKITAYTQRTHLLFSLGSLNNLARNGRVNPAVAKIAGVLNIRIVGKASDKGELESLNKCRGERKALEQVLKHMSEMGFSNGKVRISHTNNPLAASKMRELIEQSFPFSNITVIPNTGLCSFYAEDGSVLVGFETD